MSMFERITEDERRLAL